MIPPLRPLTIERVLALFFDCRGKKERIELRESRCANEQEKGCALALY